ncbi:LppX_LprAFG lipoprotein [Thermomonospora umbrina]|uniref:Uncharacterized protein DUF1396 n=1 Tax=Thermomonospora umbrina TaxID=111806 RepID=A0A3D9SR39_9ACTN|nr:LppX_LprAFG lipoprotein [Thermomonospora umbrina]REE98097.1 uncharacterized protein DUF1396 [Thermomonospora umbrina]
MERRTALRTTVVVAAGSAIAATLTACGSDGGSGNAGTINLPADTALVKASQRTGQADSFEADLTIADTGDGGTTIRGSGDVRLRPNLAFTATLDQLKVGGQTLPGVGSRAILVGDTLYAKVPRLAEFATGGKPWLRLNVDRTGRRLGFGFDEITDAVQRVNPAEQTKMFTGSKDARRVGEEKIEGVRTGHYTGTVTLQDALNRLDPQTREKVRRWHTDGSDRLAFDIWIDSENLPRKLVVKGTSKGHETSTVTVLYRDYGKKIRVNPPPADQVGDVTDTVGRFLGGGN